MKNRVIPLGLKQANEYIVKNHRHHGKVQGHKFSIGLLDNNDVLIGVAVCGRPLSRHYDNGQTIEVTRLCTNGAYNACSQLYGRAAKIVKYMGYTKIITYILESESGNSLKASGWKCEARNVGGINWNSSKKIKRDNTVIDLFGTKLKYPKEKKQRWVLNLTII